MHPERRSGAVIAATWLIGLGLVFLLQRGLDLSWGQAWPMFVVLAGVGGLVSVLVGARGGVALAALAWPIFLLVVGVLFLLSTTGVLGVELGELVARWWPVALIVLGAWFLLAAAWPWGREPRAQDSLALPLEGAGQASVKVRFGGGQLEIGAAPGGSLLSGELEGAPANYRTNGPGVVEIWPESPASWRWDGSATWRLGLTAEVPLDLQVESGAARQQLDLSSLRLRSLRVATGASDTRIVLPRSAGHTAVRVEGGAASLVLEVPAGVAASIRSRMALGSTRVDETSFPRAGDRWESPDFATAANRVEIEIQGGVGSARVVSQASAA